MTFSEASEPLQNLEPATTGIWLDPVIDGEPPIEVRHTKPSEGLLTVGIPRIVEVIYHDEAA